MKEHECEFCPHEMKPEPEIPTRQAIVLLLVGAIFGAALFSWGVRAMQP